jgi:perosamine synthetase
MIHIAEPQLLGREVEYVTDCLRRGQLSAGPYVDRFEGLLTQACGAPFAAVCCNGTAALHLALLALDLQPGDEVLVPNLTYVATANAVRYCGGVPVPCDVNPLTWMLDEETALARATDRTVGLIAVHLYGHIADVPALEALARTHGWWIVEDAAEAIGAEWGGRPIGSFGHLTTLSFYGNKIITTGEGGMGLQLAYACCNQFVINCAPSQLTEVITLLDVRYKPTELGRSASFHTFFEKGTA